jgi:hypothetical protein
MGLQMEYGAAPVSMVGVLSLPLPSVSHRAIHMHPSHRPAAYVSLYVLYPDALLEQVPSCGCRELALLRRNTSTQPSRVTVPPPEDSLITSADSSPRMITSPSFPPRLTVRPFPLLSPCTTMGLPNTESLTHWSIVMAPLQIVAAPCSWDPILTRSLMHSNVPQPSPAREPFTSPLQTDVAPLEVAETSVERAASPIPQVRLGHSSPPRSLPSICSVWFHRLTALAYRGLPSGCAVCRPHATRVPRPRPPPSCDAAPVPPPLRQRPAWTTHATLSGRWGSSGRGSCMKDLPGSLAGLSQHPSRAQPLDSLPHPPRPSHSP